jgi:protoporphyrinogen oxidase
MLRPVDLMLDPDLSSRTVILGGGPAGLSAAYELARQSHTPLVLESDDVVGGLARTVSYKEFLFDIGGHRFFTKSSEVQQLWQEILGSQLMTRSRLSRIRYRNRFFHYPLKPFSALLSLGPLEALLIVGSYLRWHFFPYREVKSFEQYVTNHFGKRLFEMFFRTYTEKVWGIACSEISADWAAQRIRNLSLLRAVRAALRPSRGDAIRSLVEQFSYPERGPGQMWETLASRLEEMGHPVRKGRRVAKILHDGRAVTSVATEGQHGTEQFHGKQSGPVAAGTRSGRFAECNCALCSRGRAGCSGQPINRGRPRLEPYSRIRRAGRRQCVSPLQSRAKGTGRDVRAGKRSPNPLS